MRIDQLFIADRDKEIEKALNLKQNSLVRVDGSYYQGQSASGATLSIYVKHLGNGTISIEKILTEDEVQTAKGRWEQLREFISFVEYDVNHSAGSGIPNDLCFEVKLLGREVKIPVTVDTFIILLAAFKDILKEMVEDWSEGN